MTDRLENRINQVSNVRRVQPRERRLERLERPAEIGITTACAPVPARSFTTSMFDPLMLNTSSAPAATAAAISRDRTCRC